MLPLFETEVFFLINQSINDAAGDAPYVSLKTNRRCS